MSWENEVVERIESMGVIPVVVLDDAADAIPVAKALTCGGLPCAEVTFRTEAAEESIRAIASSIPDMLVGAGTVLTVAQAERAIGAGAEFIVAPGFDSELVDWCLDRRVPVIPGVMTPTEVTMARKRGLNLVKFFPAGQNGGVAGVNAIGAPFPGMRFLPTGGVNPGNLAEYLRCARVAACGGTWLAKNDVVRAGDFGTVEALAAEATSIVKEVRG